MREILPRAVLALLFSFGAIFAFLETAYLQDQAFEFKEPKIVMWTWVFRTITLALVGGALFFGADSARRML